MGSTIFLSRILSQYAAHDTLDAFIFPRIQVRASPTCYLDWTYNCMRVPYNSYIELYTLTSISIPPVCYYGEVIPLKTAPPGTPSPFSYLSFSTFISTQPHRYPISPKHHFIVSLVFSFSHLFLILYRYILSIYAFQPLVSSFLFPWIHILGL